MRIRIVIEYEDGQREQMSELRVSAGRSTYPVGGPDRTGTEKTAVDFLRAHFRAFEDGAIV